VQAAVAKSVAMGFEESELVEASVRLMFDFHPGYVGHPDVKAILAREGSTPREKLLAILAWYGRATWAGSFDQLAGGAWQ
jgi:hypothetical protein